MYRSKLALIAAVLVAAFSGNAAADDVQKAIQINNAGLVADLLRGDAESVAERYTSDAAVFPPGGSVARGTAAIEAFWTAALTAGIEDVELTTATVESAGDLAFEEGTVSITDGKGQTTSGALHRRLETRRRRMEAASGHLELIPTSRNELMRQYIEFERRNFVSSFHIRSIHNGVLRFVSDSEEGSCILHHQFPHGASVAQVIEEQVESFNDLRKNFEWKVYATDEPATLAAELIKQGFREGPVESFMVLDLKAAPPALFSTSPLDVRRITDNAGVRDAVSVAERVWNDPMEDRIDALATQLHRSPESISIYVVYANDDPVSSAWINFNRGEPFRGTLGWLDAARSSRPRLLSGASRRTGARSAGARREVPHDRCISDEPADRRAVRLRMDYRHTPL